MWSGCGAAPSGVALSHALVATCGIVCYDSDMSKTSNAKTVDTTEFQASHIRLPRGRGGWIFVNLDSGAEHTFSGTYTGARRSLPAGAWKVCP